ncbi:hypothetical protein Hypma_005377 [Hypsizygus marmoreus]|uniref:Uncharacterized protein n=1 Tax=Hypsizygus marmoreus TaxID=39966 RepID=A0A369JZR0_HYPMA|nr:hypothetical protein Hypma_005377 [Hypsizygus marmoreus]
MLSVRPRHRIFLFHHELRSQHERRERVKFQILSGSFAARGALVEKLGPCSLDFALHSPTHTSKSTSDPAHHTVRVAKLNGKVFLATLHIDDDGKVLGKIYFENKESKRKFKRERFMEI